MSITRKSVKRVYGLLVVLSLLHAGNAVGRAIQEERKQFNYQSLKLEGELSEARRTIAESEALYMDKLTEIAVALYDRDYHNMGGYSTTEGESVTILYETILNEVRDYRTLLFEMGNYFDRRKDYVDSLPSVWPIAYNGFTRVTSGYGWRLSPTVGTPQFHAGIDLTGTWDSEVIATADGVVIEHWPPPGLYGGVRFRGHDSLGGMVKLRHEGGIETVYGHLKTTYVHVGKRVSRGEAIGVMGNTGVSTGIHLHYEIHVAGRPVDPIGFLKF